MWRSEEQLKELSIEDLARLVESGEMSLEYIEDHLGEDVAKQVTEKLGA